MQSKYTTMKQILTVLAISMLLVACGEGEPKSLEAILETNDAAAIQQERNALVTQQQEVNAKLKLLDDKLDELNPETKMPLITSFVVESKKFDHYLELQGSVETKQNIVITPEMGGILQRVFVKEGDKVSRGQVLARIDDGGMGQQVAQLQIHFIHNS